MKLIPDNGSRTANILLVLAGVAVGLGFAALLPDKADRNQGSTFAKPSDSAARPRSSAGASALSRQSDGPGRSSGQLATMNALERAEFHREAGARAARQNLRNALARAEAMSSARDKLEFYRGIYSVWAEQDPAGSLDHAQSSFAAGRLQSELIGIAMSKWGLDHPREAWMWAEAHLNGPLKDRAMTDLVMGWTRRSPADAASWLADSGLTVQPLFTAVARTWAESNPRAAAAWADTLPEGKAKQTAEVAVATTVAEDDPAAALELYEDEIVSGENLNLTTAIADLWATTDPAGAAEWIASLPESRAKLEAAATLATVWAASDIHAAVAWSEQIQDAVVRRQVVSHVATSWGAIEPEAALDWLGTLPPQEASDGVTGAFYSWAGTSPNSLQAWIDQAPADAYSDRARLSLGDVLSQQNPAGALDLALGMSSEATRNHSAARYFREWRKRDDASAQDWLDAVWSTLPASTQDQLAIEQRREVSPK